MNLLSLALLGTGGVLLYSAVKGVDPRDVVKAALTNKPMSTVAYKYAATPPAVETATYSPTTDPAPGATGV